MYQMSYPRLTATIGIGTSSKMKQAHKRNNIFTDGVALADSGLLRIILRMRFLIPNTCNSYEAVHVTCTKHSMALVYYIVWSKMTLFISGHHHAINRGSSFYFRANQPYGDKAIFMTYLLKLFILIRTKESRVISLIIPFLLPIQSVSTLWTKTCLPN